MHQVTITDAKTNEPLLTTTLPFLPSVGNHIIVEGVEFKVKAPIRIDYDNGDVTIKGIPQ